VSLANLLIIPIAIFLVWLGLSYYGLVLAIIIGEGLFVSAIIASLWRQGYALDLDVMGQLRIITAAGIAGGIGFLFKTTLGGDGFIPMLLGMAVIGLAFIATARLLRPLNEAERATIERLAGRKLYVV
jgi:hypothetical protein